MVNSLSRARARRAHGRISTKCSGFRSSMSTIFGIPTPALYRPTPDRADQRLVLRAAQPRPGGHLRPAARHQLRPWRAIHARRIRRPICCSTYARHRLLARADPGAPDRRPSSAIVLERADAERGSTSSIRSTACCSPSAWRSFSKACSATGSAPPASPIRRRRSWPAASISASCSCRSIAAGWWSPRWSICLGTWLLIEKTRLGAYLRAATENATLVQAFGVNVPLLLTLDLRPRRRARGLRRRAGGADLSGEPADGLESHHHRLRGRRRRRHGLDPRRDRHRLHARPARGPDQGVLSARPRTS